MEVPKKLVLILRGSLLSNPFLMITCFESNFVLNQGLLFFLGCIVAVLFRFGVNIDCKIVEL